jgi:hypothetical protein
MDRWRIFGLFWIVSDVLGVVFGSGADDPKSRNRDAGISKVYYEDQ